MNPNCTTCKHFKVIKFEFYMEDQNRCEKLNLILGEFNMMQSHVEDQPKDFFCCKHETKNGKKWFKS